MTIRARTVLDVRKVFLTTIAVLATFVVFALDSNLPARHNLADLYVIVVILSGLSRSVKTVVWTSLGVIALTWSGALLRLGDATHSHATNEYLVERGVTTVIIGLSALVVALVVAREAENAALGRALRSAEDDQAANRRMLLAASEIAAIGTWSMDLNDAHMSLSDKAAEMYGVAHGTRPRRGEALSRIVTEDANALSASVEAAWEHGVPFREELRMVAPDGQTRWIVAMGEKVLLEGSSRAHLHGTVQDITTWKQAELAASNQHHRFAQLTSTLPIIVWTATPDGQLDFFNDAMERYSGVAIIDLLGAQWASIVNPEDLEGVLQSWTDAIATGTRYDVEFRVRRADGTYLWHQVSAQPEHGPDGRILGWWGSAINIDAARRLATRADQLAAERDIILNSMNDGVYALDEHYRIAYVNASAEAILGHTREALVGNIIWDIFPGSAIVPAAQMIRNTMEQGIPQRVTYRSEILGKWLDLSVTRSAVGVTVFLRDVTEIQSLSEQLSQSQRLEAVGQLTGGIAHDFNNLLTVVLGGADALSEDESVSGEAREMSQMIATAAKRGAELTHRLLAFARMQPLEPRSVDLAVRLRGLEPLLRRSLGENVALVVVASEIDAMALVDPGQYDNAVINLALNARDAMPEGGSIEIATSLTTVDDSYVTAHSEVTPGHYVLTTVTDSGEGIADEDLQRLFDPFFTTKNVGKGSGLGLSMVWGFIKQSGGHVTVYSEPGIGTSFKMLLPTAQSGPTSEPPQSDPLPAPRGRGTILLAEDDDLVRRFATERLRSHGYEVVETASGPEALEALRSMHQLDLLFTDVIMPGGMTGKELADAVVKLRPGTPVLFASGYTENVIIHNGRLDQGVKLLTKPYTARKLLNLAGELVFSTGTEEP